MQEKKTDNLLKKLHSKTKNNKKYFIKNTKNFRKKADIQQLFFIIKYFPT
jgi:hypothetical protein